MNPTNITAYPQNTSDVLLNAAAGLLNTIASYLPNIIGALIIFILGLIVAKAFRGVTKKVLKLVGFTKLVEKTSLDESLQKAGIKQNTTGILATIVYWIVLLIFLSAVFEILGLEIVVKTFNQLITYLPNLIVAVITIVLALLVGRFVKGAIIASLEKLHIAHYNMIATIAEALVVLLGASIAASQLGLDITIITTNVTVIVIGIVTLLVIALGLGSRTVVSNIIGGYYTKQYYKKGEMVKLAGHKGKIKEVNNMAIILEDSDGEIVIPNEEALKKGSAQ
ncbi:MAG: mechanosensitive ion channel [Patescibacteria group bacterium]|nr:mechanosensitive ion channel [Patescibacteria group bacterium]